MKKRFATNCASPAGKSDARRAIAWRMRKITTRSKTGPIQALRSPSTTDGVPKFRGALVARALRAGVIESIVAHAGSHRAAGVGRRPDHRRRTLPRAQDRRVDGTVATHLHRESVACHARRRIY